MRSTLPLQIAILGYLLRLPSMRFPFQPTPCAIIFYFVARARQVVSITLHVEIMFVELVVQALGAIRGLTVARVFVGVRVASRGPGSKGTKDETANKGD